MGAPKFNASNDLSGGGLPVPTDPRDLVAPRGSLPPEAGYQDADADRLDYRELFFRYLGLILKHRWLIAGFATAALMIGFAINFATTPIYRATVIIQIDRAAAKVVKTDDTMTEAIDNQRFYQTQYDLLKSRSVAERVASNLDLGNAATFLYPQSQSPWAQLRRKLFPATLEVAKRNLAARKASAAAKVQSGLTIAPVINSALLKVSYDNPNPEWAQTIANGIAENFISSNLERRYGATAYARNFLKDRLDELKLKLEESEAAIVAYAEEKEIVSDESKMSLADSNLVALNQALQGVRAQRIHSQQLWEQAKDHKGMSLPQFMNDKSIETLRAQRTALTIDYQNKLGQFKPAYPDMRKLKAQIDQIDQELVAATDFIRQSLRAQYEAALNQEKLLEENIQQAKSNVLSLRSKSVQYNILQRDVDTNRTLYNALLQQYKDVGISGAVGTNNISIVDTAMRPGAPYKPDLKNNLLIALMLGLAAAAITIVVLEILEDTFKSPEELEEQLGLPALGIVPKVDGDIDIIGAIKESPTEPVAEAYRSFRTAIQFSTDQGAPKTILVTSARPGEGKSTTALALSINFAQLGMKVLLIDADLRNPSQHKMLNRENAAGLANYLAGAAVAHNVFQRTDIDGVSLMSTGPLPPNPAELLSSPKMVALLSVAGENFDVVIIDAPPVMGLADSPLLSSIAGGLCW